jgi:hypothetical protein
MLFSYGYCRWQNQQWETKHLIRRPFWSTWRCACGMQSASPDVACLGLLRKPLDAATGDYSLRIAPVATRVTINKTTMQNTPPLLAILMAVVVRRYYTAHIARWRHFMAFIKATKRRHRTSTCSNITQSDMPTPDFGFIFHRQIDKKGLELTFRPRLTMRVWHINFFSRNKDRWTVQWVSPFPLLYLSLCKSNYV